MSVLRMVWDDILLEKHAGGYEGMCCQEAILKKKVWGYVYLLFIILAEEYGAMNLLNSFGEIEYETMSLLLYVTLCLLNVLVRERCLILLCCN